MVSRMRPMVCERKTRSACGTAFGKRRAAVDGAGGDGIGDGARGTDAGDGAGEAGFAQREAEGGADQAGADDDDVLHGQNSRHSVFNAEAQRTQR